jgi:hypothetical protein
MITIQLKARHLHFIHGLLKDRSLSEWGGFLSRKTQAVENKTDEELCDMQTTPYELISAYKILTIQPEGVTARINKEMDDLLKQQLEIKVPEEIASGVTGPFGELPENAYFQRIAESITIIKQYNNTLLQDIINSGRQ